MKISSSDVFLVKGKKYDVEELVKRFSHWGRGPREVITTIGYNVYDYFSAKGFYRGPDEDGIEPIFSGGDQ